MNTCPACGHQYNGKRPEQKIDRKAALQRYDKLRDVQADMMWALFRLEVLTLQQIGDCFFDAQKPEKRKELAGRHLHVLLSAGFVEAHEPSPRHHFKKFFSLTASGIFVCATEEKMDSRKIKRVRESKAHRILAGIHTGHYLAVNEVMGSFIKAERAGLGELSWYKADREERYVFSAAGSRQTLEPDSTFYWSSNGRGFLMWLEMENSRASVKDFEAKIHKYHLWSRAGFNPGDEYRRMLGQESFPPLLVVAAKRSQLPSLKQATVTGLLKAKTETLPEVAKRIVVAFSYLDLIREHGVLGEVWECPLKATGRLHSLQEAFSLR